MATYIPNKNGEIEKHITFSWSHVNVRIRETSSSNTESGYLLRDVSGIAYPGELLVLMGPSGAGKSTLLNCLTLRNLKGLSVSGSTFINKQPVTKTDLASLSAYVQQEELFIGCLTVREHLIFHALMRMESSYSEKLERVEEVLSELSLKSCENTQIGIPGIIKGISGGERKRLALASEFLMNPFLIFFDEPTTSLDSFMSLNVVHMLKRIAQGGRTVIATLHQPSSEIFHLIDRLCLVGQGRIAFLGTRTEAHDFFTKLKVSCPKDFNPADHYIQLLSIIPGMEEKCGKTVEKIADAFKESTIGKEIEIIARDERKISPLSSDNNNKKIYKNGWYIQLKGLFWRSWLTVIKNPESIENRLLILFVESFLIFIIYNGITLTQAGVANMEGILSFLLISLSFQEVFWGINAFCLEKPLFIKEHNDGLYRTDLYFLSKIICQIPMSFLCDVLLTTVCYSTFGPTVKVEMREYFTALSISVLVGQVAQGLGYIISFLVASVELAPGFVNVIVVPLMILGGIFLNIRLISDFSWFKYAFEAFMINLWSTIKYIPCEANSTLASTCFTDGSQVLRSLSIGIGEFWTAIINLVFLVIVFRIVAFLLIFYRASKSDL